MAPKRIVVLLTLLAAVGALVSIAFARPRVAIAEPRITSAPHDPTNQRAATFAFRGRAGVSLQCSLDGASFTACSSPKTYTALTVARHRFRVRAAVGLDRSSADAYAWRIDTSAPPAPRIVEGPANPSSSRSARFRFTDANRDVDFLCKLDGGSYARCGSPKSYSGLLEGPHAFSVVARDEAGNSSPATTASWVVDWIAPPTPVLTGHPSDPTTSTVAAFAFADADLQAGFECRLRNDGGDSGWRSCASPYNGTAKTGRNRFDVRAHDGAGNTSDAVTFSWTVQEPPAEQPGVPFSIGGNASGLLYPGRGVPIDLVLTNPNGVAITVTAVTVAISGTSTSSCPVAGNFLIASQLAGPVTVPANSTRSLSQLGVPQGSWPQLAMASPPANQDGCKNAIVNLAYSGSAHS